MRDVLWIVLKLVYRVHGGIIWEILERKYQKLWICPKMLAKLELTSLFQPIPPLSVMHDQEKCRSRGCWPVAQERIEGGEGRKNGDCFQSCEPLLFCPSPPSLSPLSSLKLTPLSPFFAEKRNIKTGSNEWGEGEDQVGGGGGGGGGLLCSS